MALVGVKEAYSILEVRPARASLTADQPGGVSGSRGTVWADLARVPGRSAARRSSR
jgi:hypothetical protein